MKGRERKDLPIERETKGTRGFEKMKKETITYHPFCCCLSHPSMDTGDVPFFFFFCVVPSMLLSMEDGDLLGLHRAIVQYDHEVNPG